MLISCRVNANKFLGYLKITWLKIIFVTVFQKRVVSITMLYCTNINVLDNCSITIIILSESHDVTCKETKAFWLVLKKRMYVV